MHTHNQWINVLSELGLVGLVLFVVAVGGLLVAALRPQRGHQQAADGHDEQDEPHEAQLAQHVDPLIVGVHDDEPRVGAVEVVREAEGAGAGCRPAGDAGSSRGLRGAMAIRPSLPSASRRPAPLVVEASDGLDEVNWSRALLTSPPTPPYRAAKASPATLTTTTTTASVRAPTTRRRRPASGTARVTSAAAVWATIARQIAASAQRPKA